MIVRTFLSFSFLDCYGSWATKIRPWEKIHSFATKIGNIIIEETISKRKNYFLWKKFETEK